MQEENARLTVLSTAQKEPADEQSKPTEARADAPVSEDELATMHQQSADMSEELSELKRQVRQSKHAFMAMHVKFTSFLRSCPC